MINTYQVLEEITILSLSMCFKNTFIWVGFLITYLIIIIALCLGEENISPIKLFDYIFADDDILRQITIDARLSRVIMPILIGMLLSSSGTITQNVFSNPIADPYIIGIASTATFGAVIAYLFRLEDYYYGIFAFIFSSIFSLVIFKISAKTSITILLIIGIATSSFLGAFTSFFTYIIGKNSFKIVAWLMGNIGLNSWFHVKFSFYLYYLVYFIFMLIKML